MKYFITFTYSVPEKGEKIIDTRLEISKNNQVKVYKQHYKNSFRHSYQQIKEHVFLT